MTGNFSEKLLFLHPETELSEGYYTDINKLF